MQQSYKNSELLILADGAEVRSLIPEHPRIRLIHLEGPINVGDKRNYGCERAAGSVIAHWDDDDYSAPGRLDDQIDRLTGSDKSVTGYFGMRFTNPETGQWWKYTGQPNYALGTSLVYQVAWWRQNRFQSLQVGEDNQFVAMACARDQLLTADAGEFMHATIHPGNTSPRQLGSSWKAIL